VFSGRVPFHVLQIHYTHSSGPIPVEHTVDGFLELDAITFVYIVSINPNSIGGSTKTVKGIGEYFAKLLDLRRIVIERKAASIRNNIIVGYFSSSPCV
jgi:hypothetical protein